MPKPRLVRLEEVAAYPNLVEAFWRAAKGKRMHKEVQRFEARLTRELLRLRDELLRGSVPVGSSHRFRIHDPKPRTIHAPCFKERVLHHAVMALVGPVLDRTLVDDCCACRRGKGSLAAVHRAQQHARRFAYFAKLDARSYFASIDHEVLLQLLHRRIKGRGIRLLLQQIIASHESAPGRGLPIGSLTSQHFANLYLGVVDRLVLEEQKLGLVRYMDDLVVFGRSRREVADGAEAAQALAREVLRLNLALEQPPTATTRGIPLCGFRVFGDRLLLSGRRKRRYRQGRRYWETAFTLGLVSSRGLQGAYSSTKAITSHAQSTSWRHRQLLRNPAPDA